MAMACHDYTNKLSYNFAPCAKPYQSTMTGSAQKTKPTLPIVSKKSYKSRTTTTTTTTGASGRKGKTTEDPDYLAHGTGIPRYENLP